MIDRTRLFRDAANLFDLECDMIQGHEWLIAADWIEQQGDETLAAEVRKVAYTRPSLQLNNCSCGYLSLMFMPMPRYKQYGWGHVACCLCKRQTPNVRTWGERVLAWNLMHPGMQPYRDFHVINRAIKPVTTYVKIGSQIKIKRLGQATNAK